jgi:hypothetical protein
VILVNFRGADDTIEAVKGLRAQNWPVDLLEIIIVENASGDGSLDKLRGIEGGVKVVESSKNLGFTGGCNLGAEAATGEFLAFLNNDARPHPDWMSEGIRTFGSGQNIAAVASKVLDWEGERVDYVGASVTWYGMGYKPHAGEVDRGSWDQERDVLFGTGAAMFVKTKVFIELGGFDDNFFMFYDDVDLGWRLNLLGYRFRFQPKSLVFHKHHASINKFGHFREQYLLERNALYCLYKNLDDTSLAQVFPGALLLAVRRAVARGPNDSSQLDLRIDGDDTQSSMPIAKSTMAGIFAIDQFVEHLPTMTIERAQVQSTRKVSDRQLKSLFGNMDEPAFPIDSYLSGYGKIAASLGILNLGERRRVLVITGDPVGERMAGPAIRAWNIARILAAEHEVRLISTNSATSISDAFSVGYVSNQRPKTMQPHEEWADIIILQGLALKVFPSLETTSKVLVVDIYDPMHLEQLEQGKDLPFTVWNDQIAHSTGALNHQMQLGDFFLCASDRQRNFWLGQLAALGRVNAFTYSRDTGLDSLIAVAPFGIPSQEPTTTMPAIRGVVPGISASDKVIIWGGGIYNWFDTQTLIRAVATLAERRPNVRLFFLGVKHPNRDVPEMSAVSEARMLATRLGVNNKNVFFNETWVPYEERQNYLVEADIGVSTHFAHIETKFSFRTRILDYLWAGLPIVSTRGDSFGDLVGTENLGASVPEQDERALVDALETLLFDEEAHAIAKANVLRIREQFTWERALKPLLDFCRAPLLAADREGITAGISRSATKRGLLVVSGESSNYRGLRRDLNRVRYYFNNGGVGAVVERYRARRARMIQSRV